MGLGLRAVLGCLRLSTYSHGHLKSSWGEISSLQSTGRMDCDRLANGETPGRACAKFYDNKT